MLLSSDTLRESGSSGKGGVCTMEVRDTSDFGQNIYLRNLRSILRVFAALL